MSQKNPEKSPVAPSYGQNGFVVGWVSNRQNRSPTDEMAPSAPQKRPYPGPQGHMGPQTGFTGSAFSMQTTLVGGRLAQNGPQDRENPLFGDFALFWAPNMAAKFLQVPQTP